MQCFIPVAIYLYVLAVLFRDVLSNIFLYGCSALIFHIQKIRYFNWCQCGHGIVTDQDNLRQSYLTMFWTLVVYYCGLGIDKSYCPVFTLRVDPSTSHVDVDVVYGRFRRENNPWPPKWFIIRNVDGRSPSKMGFIVQLIINICKDNICEYIFVCDGFEWALLT